MTFQVVLAATQTLPSIVAPATFCASFSLLLLPLKGLNIINFTRVYGYVAVAHLDSPELQGCLLTAGFLQQFSARVPLYVPG